MSEANATALLLKAVEKLDRNVEELHKQLVRQDVYAEARKADQQAVREVEKDITELKESKAEKKDVADLVRWKDWITRGVIGAIAVSVIPSIIMLYVQTQVVR